MLVGTRKNNYKIESSIDSDMITFENLYQNNIVGIVDIVNSTGIISKMSQRQACQYYSIFHNSLSYIINEHNAMVVKNIGDGILFYFPDMKSLDSALSCSDEILKANKMINKIFEKQKIPKIKYRISMDYGPLMIAKCKISSCKDIFGPTVNVCAKINHLADPNQIVIGSDLYQIVRKTKYRFTQVASFHSEIKHAYPVYAMQVLQ